MDPNPYDAFLADLLRPIDTVVPPRVALRGADVDPPLRLPAEPGHRKAAIPFDHDALKNRLPLDALPFDPDRRRAQALYAGSPLAKASAEAKRPYVHDPIRAVEQTARALPEGLRVRAEKAGLLAEDFVLDPLRKMGALVGAGEGLDTSRDPSVALRRADAVHTQENERRLANLQAAEEDYQAALPKVNPWSAAGIASATVRSAPDTLAALLAGTLGGGPLAGAMMFGAGGVEEYGSRRLSGKSPLQSAEAGLVSGAAEVVGEALPLGFYLKQIQGLGKREAGHALSRLSRGMINDAAGEMITEGLNIGYQAGMLHEDMTLAEAVDRVLYSGVVGTAMGGGIQGSIEVTRPIVSRVSSVHSRPEQMPLEKAQPVFRSEEGAGPMYSRTRGWADFPDALIAAPPGATRKHADYHAAKEGDPDSALRLVQDILRPEAIDRIRQAIGNREPTIVAVHAIEAAGKNKIPMAFATALGRHLGLPVERKIVQAKKVSRGGSDGFHRLANQPTFQGAIEPRDYVIVDDTLTQGGTLAQLKEYIESNGGRVILAAALTGKGYSAKLALSEDSLRGLKERYGSLEPWWREHFGHGFEGLTESEARYILKSGQGSDALRDRILAAGQGGGLSEDDGPVRPMGEGGTGEARPEVSRATVPVTREAPPKAGLSVFEVRRVLSDRLGKTLVNRLEQSGRLRIVQGQTALPGQVQGRVRGMHAAGVTTLVAGNLTPETVTGVLLHESGHGAGVQMETLLGRRYGALVERFRALSQGGGKFDRELAEEAERRAQSEMELRRIDGLSVTPADLDAERIMHFIELVEGAPRDRILLRARQLQRDLVAAFRQWVMDRRHLPGPLRHALAQSMTGADFVHLTRRSLDELPSDRVSSKDEVIPE